MIWVNSLLSLVEEYPMTTRKEYSSSAEYVRRVSQSDHGNVFHKEGECRSITAKPTYIQKEKDIPRLPEI